MNILTFVLMTLVCVTSQQEPASPKQVDPRTELATTIQYALDLLEEEKHEEYIQRLAFPPDLKKALKTREIDDLVASFVKDKAKVTRAVLEKIKNQQPKMNEDGTVAEFPVDEKYFFARDKIVFEKSGEFWFIRN